MSNNSREAAGRLSDEEFTKMMNGFNSNYIDIRSLDRKKVLYCLQQRKEKPIQDYNIIDNNK